MRLQVFLKKFSVIMLMAVLTAMSSVIIAFADTSEEDNVPAYITFYMLDDTDPFSTINKSSYSRQTAVTIDIPPTGESCVCFCDIPDATQNEVWQMMHDYQMTTSGGALPLLWEGDRRATRDGYYHVIMAYRYTSGVVELRLCYLKKTEKFPNYYFVLNDWRKEVGACPYTLNKQSEDDYQVCVTGYNGAGEFYDAYLFSAGKGEVKNFELNVVDGRLVVGNTMSSDDDAWNSVYDALRAIVNGVLCACLGACSVFLMIQIFRLALSAGNPQMRSAALRGLLWCGLGCAGLGSAYAVFMMCYSFFG